MAASLSRGHLPVELQQCAKVVNLVMLHQVACAYKVKGTDTIFGDFCAITSFCGVTKVILYVWQPAHAKTAGIDDQIPLW